MKIKVKAKNKKDYKLAKKAEEILNEWNTFTYVTQVRECLLKNLLTYGTVASAKNEIYALMLLEGYEPKDLDPLWAAIVSLQNEFLG